MARLPVSSVGSAGSLPRDTEEGRALLQSRLAQFGQLGVYLSGGFVLALGLTAVFLPFPSAWETVLAQSVCFAASLLVRRLRRCQPISAAWLIAIDYAFAWTVCAASLALGFTLPIDSRPELMQLAAVTDMLAARAFLVPSTTRRTALVGVFPMGGMVLSTWWFYRHGAPFAVDLGTATYVVLSTLLAVGPLVITSLTSRTIFGLRQRARDAQQLGQYTLLEKIGEGGMGVVYKARHATLRRPTAIKLLPTERAGANNLLRFEREVQLTAQLTHPNTIAIFDYGRSADGILYYAMEYLDGLDLESMVALAGPLLEARVVHVLTQVCAALGEAHEAGLMHRDIKPQNVLLCTRGGARDFAKVVDFGLVKELDRPTDASLSSTNTIVGTPLYMSPEAIVRPHELDARGDLYALGAVGYFLLTGTPPFRGASVVEICGQHLHAAPEPLAQRVQTPVSAALEALIFRCLEKKPEARPQTALELSDALHALTLPSWSRQQAASWWDEHAAAIEAFKRQRVAERASSLPHRTVNVDLRERGTPVEAWQSAPTHPKS